MVHFLKPMWASLVAYMVKNLPAKQEIQVESLGREDPPEQRIAAHSSIFAWRSLWTEEPGVLPSMGWRRVGHDWVTNTFTFFFIKCTHHEETLRLTMDFEGSSSFNEVSFLVKKKKKANLLSDGDNGTCVWGQRLHGKSLSFLSVLL